MLTSLDLKNFNTKNVTYMDGMFATCMALKSLDLKNFNTQNVTDMSGMFYDCKALTSLDLKNFNTQNVTDMSRMFSDCITLTSLDLKNFNTQNVTNMSSMFSGCSRLKTITQHQYMAMRPNSRDMFFSCKQLRGAVKFDEYERDATMANPETGYFTDSISRAYVQQSEDQQTLTFYYDPLRNTRTGTTWDIDETDAEYKYLSAWAGTEEHPQHPRPQRWCLMPPSKTIALPLCWMVFLL